MDVLSCLRRSGLKNQFKVCSCSKETLLLGACSPLGVCSSVSASPRGKEKSDVWLEKANTLSRQLGSVRINGVTAGAPFLRAFTFTPP